MVAIAHRTDEQGAPRPRPWYAHLYLQVLLAIVAGVLVGHFFPDTGSALRPLGDGFIKLVKMIIAPIVFLTVVTGIASIGEARALGRVAAKTFAYFLFFSTLALIVAEPTTAPRRDCAYRPVFWRHHLWSFLTGIAVRR